MPDPRHLQKLQDPNRNIRIRGVVALGAEIGPSAVSPLARALGDRDGRVRWTAVRVLSAWNDPAAVPLLIRALGDKESKVRLASAKALGERQDPIAIEPLFDQLADSDPQVAAKCRASLRRFGEALIPSLWGRFLDSRPVVRQTAADFLVELAPKTIEILCRLMQSEEEGVAESAAETLLRIARECPSVALHSAVPLLRSRIAPWWNRADAGNKIYREAIAAIEAGTASIRDRPIPAALATVPSDRPIPSSSPGPDLRSLPLPESDGD